MNTQLYLRAYELMCCVKHMAQTYDDQRQICKYVHSTSRGHEAIQLAVGLQLKPQDYLAVYYRDESILLGLGFEPYELMLQLIAKRAHVELGPDTVLDRAEDLTVGRSVLPGFVGEVGRLRRQIVAGTSLGIQTVAVRAVSGIRLLARGDRLRRRRHRVLDFGGVRVALSGDIEAG